MAALELGVLKRVAGILPFCGLGQAETLRRPVRPMLSSRDDEAAFSQRGASRKRLQEAYLAPAFLQSWSAL